MDDTTKKLREAAKKTLPHSYSPYSNVQVASSVLMDDGQIYSGINVENSSFGATVCAERIAIFKGISEGARKIKKIYIYTKNGWPPCGLCRQVITEFATKETEIIVGDEKSNEKIYTLNEIFPFAFTPDHLNG